MDLATVTRARELAAVYGGVGLDQEENNLRCSLCIENKQFMRVMHDFLAGARLAPCTPAKIDVTH